MASASFDLAENPAEFLLEPGLHGFEQRLGFGLPDMPPLVGRAAADARLDGVDLGDAAQCFAGNR